MFAKIVGTGSFLPAKSLANSYFESYLDTSDSWIQSRSGIRSRYVAGPQDTVASMGVSAAKNALQSASLQVQDVDLIIVATCSHDKIFPSAACCIQDILGAHDCPAFDIQAACAGFVYALSVARSYIESGAAKSALIIGSEVMTRTIDWQDRRTCVLFGDGAGAVVMQAGDKPGILASCIKANGCHSSILNLNNMTTIEEKSDKSPYLHMDGASVFKLAVNKLSQSATDILRQANMEPCQLDWFVPHQANLRIITAIAKKLELPMSKVIQTVAEHGNTSAASIPLALDSGVRQEKIVPGNLVLLEAFGGGLAWGSVLLNYG